jgi:hypothetical protein
MFYCYNFYFFVTLLQFWFKIQKQQIQWRCCNAILNYGMQSALVNVCIAIRVFLTMPVTVAFAERSFSKLKLIKNYLRAKIETRASQQPGNYVY